MEPCAAVRIKSPRDAPREPHITETFGWGVVSKPRRHFAVGVCCSSCFLRFDALPTCTLCKILGMVGEDFGCMS